MENREKKRSSEDHNDSEQRKKPRHLPEALVTLRKLYEDTTPWRGNVHAKLNQAAPYYFFLNRVQDCLETYDEDLTLSFPELLDSSLGQIEHTLHITFWLEVGWLLAQYAIVGLFNPSLTVLYGPESPDVTITPSMKVTALPIKCPNVYGKHHTKLSIFYYKDQSIRILVTTANLIETDWTNRTQGIWLSPKCPYMEETTPINYGESRTLFKYDLMTYLKFYKLPDLEIWLKRLQKADMSLINVFFVASVPTNDKHGVFGLNKMHRVLSKNMNMECLKWPLVTQCSSIGSLGQNSTTWLNSTFANRMIGHTGSGILSETKVIYPSLDNVRSSIDGMLGGNCLPYQSTVHKRQLWMNNLFYQWKSPHRYRSKAMPHIKTYTQLSPDFQKSAWFLLTSANLSKAAWGSLQNSDSIRMMSYEAGVLFLPQYIINKSTFEIRKHGNNDGSIESFPFPYDPHLTPYKPNDEVFLYDKAFELPT